MAKYKDSTFKNTQVPLDFNTFEKCLFENCTMIYSGAGPVSLVGCTFRDVSWAFVGAAQNTLQFMSGLYQGGGKDLIENTFNLIRQDKLAKQANPIDVIPSTSIVQT